MRKLTACVALLDRPRSRSCSCRPYWASSPFNRPCPSNPKLLPNSPGIVDRLDGWGPVQQLRVGPGRHRGGLLPPALLGPAAGPLVHGALPPLDDSCEVEGARVRIPRAARAAGGADGHMAVVQPDGWEYDFWQVQSKPAGGGTLVVSHGGRTRIDGDGLGSDATAAEFGLAAGVIGGDRRCRPAGSTTRCSCTRAARHGRWSTPPRPGTTGHVCCHGRVRRNAPAARRAPVAQPERRPDQRAAGAALEEDHPARAPPATAGYVGDTTGGQRLVGHPGDVRAPPTRASGGSRPVGDVRPARRGCERWDGALLLRRGLRGGLDALPRGGGPLRGPADRAAERPG